MISIIYAYIFLYMVLCIQTCAYRQGYSFTVTSKWVRWRQNHRRLDCLLNRLFMCISKKTPKLRVTGPCEGDLLVTGGFPSQSSSNAENVSTWWRHHAYFLNPEGSCVTYMLRENCNHWIWLLLTRPQLYETHQIPTLKIFSYCLATVFAESLEARC